MRSPPPALAPALAFQASRPRGFPGRAVMSGELVHSVWAVNTVPKRQRFVESRTDTHEGAPLKPKGRETMRGCYGAAVQHYAEGRPPGDRAAVGDLKIMSRVVCPLCKTGFEANISPANIAVNCVSCGVAFSAAHFLHKDTTPSNSSSKRDSGKMESPAHQAASPSTRTAGLPLIQAVIPAFVGSLLVAAAVVVTASSPRFPTTCRRILTRYQGG